MKALERIWCFYGWKLKAIWLEGVVVFDSHVNLYLFCLFTFSLIFFMKLSYDNYGFLVWWWVRGRLHNFLERETYVLFLSFFFRSVSFSACAIFISKDCWCYSFIILIEIYLLTLRICWIYWLWCNMRRERWINYLNEFNCGLNYLLGVDVRKKEIRG